MRKKKFLSEDELVEALRHSRKAGYDALYDMYASALYGVIVRIVQLDDMAEDVLQEVFVRIWNSFSSYDADKGRLFTWMLHLARNMAIDKIRSKEFKNTIKNDSIDLGVSNTSDISGVSDKTDIVGVKDLLSHLKPEQRVIVDYVFLKGYTHTEVAEEFGMPLGTVKTRLRMGIMQLRKFFN